ncbi:leucine-rich repeat neuronal protein 1-like [Mytilus edulis]|uniref:leucine-rich repeat neuronal protein 1-like n=1 Tax=Mytilus edulis TaxID=6550 RepID=UPI0039EF87A8
MHLSLRQLIKGRLIIFLLLGMKLFTGIESRMDWNVECPLKCACYIGRLDTENFKQVMKIVNCTKAGLLLIPQNLSSSTEALIVSSNSIKDLNLPPRMRQLKYLDVSNNKVTTFDKQIQKLIQLRNLNLHGNFITTLRNGQFSGLKYLINLDLSKNKLRYIEKHAFGGLNYVQRLNLEDNNLNTLENQWFVGMPSLKWLYFSRNVLRELRSGVFDTSNHLDTISFTENKIRNIENNAFFGLEQLATLDLSNNNILSIPSKSFLKLPNLKKLNFDGNPIYRLVRETFCNLNVSVLSLSYMPHLSVIEEGAFANLTKLISLQLHDNQKLVFIDPNAFENIPSLRNLYIHNNRLRVLPHKIIQSLPSIKVCHFYSNLLHCDCNIDWMVNDILSKNHTSIMYDGAMLICYTPPSRYGLPIVSLPQTNQTQNCVPLTIPIYDKNYEVSIGEELRLECHATGVPEPNITWMLPNGSMLSQSIKYNRIEVKDKFILIVRHLQKSDSGLYACQATNSEGFDISETLVKVINKPIRIIALPSTLNYITITWNGTKYWSMISDYQIHYREAKSRVNYRIVHLSPYSRRYTFSNLKSYTSYEFCIVYVYSTEVYPVDCINATSGKALDYLPGITSVNTKAVAAVITIVVMIFILACAVMVVRKFKRRKSYNSTTDEEDTFVTTQIPLENVYQPNTYMCSSKTSLIRAQEQ